METCNETATPMEAARSSSNSRKLVTEMAEVREGSTTKVAKDCKMDDACSAAEHSEYQFFVGSLMYQMTAARLDLAFTIAFLSKYSSSPSKKHLATA